MSEDPHRVVYDFTIFGSDGVTPWFGTATSEGEVTEADFQTPDSVLSHSRPYLKLPSNFAATEVNFLEGSSDIGAVSIPVMDKRQTTLDQTSGLVTSKVKDAPGRRAVLRRWVPELSQYIKLFDGVIHSYSVDTDNPLIYWFHLRDTREFERSGDLFFSNYVIFGEDGRQGPADDYGKIPHFYVRTDAPADTPVLVPGVDPWLSVSAHGFDHFEYGSDASPADGIHFGYTPIAGVGVGKERPVPALFKDLAWPVQDNDGIWYYRDLQIRWRAKGSDDDWTYLRNMPVASYRNATTDRFIRVTTRSGEVAGGAYALYMASTDPTELPSQGQEFEMQVMATEITPATPFFWDNGSLGDLLKEIQNGDHTDELPRERYDATALDQFAENTPRARFILKSKVTNRRSWMEENIFKPAMYAPAIGEDLAVRPTTWLLPKNTESVSTLDPDTIQPLGEWEDSVGKAVEGVNFKYIREHLDPLKTRIVREEASWWKFWADDVERKVPDDERKTWERLVETEVEFEQRVSDPPPGAKMLKYAPITIRSFAGQDGAPNSGDVQDEAGWQLATRIFETVTAKVRGGSLSFEALVTATAENLQRFVGEWVRVKLPWMPNYKTGKRGANRYMQIYGISDEDPHYRKMKLQDGGASAPPDDAESDDGVDCLSGGELYVSPEGYSMRLFTEDGFITNTCSEPVTLKRCLLIAGGGSGGSTDTRGGGGAGGVIELEEEDAVVIGPGESVPVHVGTGGVGDNADGEDSVLWVDANGIALDPNTDPKPSKLRARGGGAGGVSNGSGGGSGGGGGRGSGGGTPTTTAGGSGFEDQGNDGGSGASTSCVGFCCRQAGGGGGSYAEAGKSAGGVGSSTGGDGGASMDLAEFGIKAGGGGQGGSHRDDSSGDCSSHGGTLERPGESGTGYGAGGGGAAGGVAGGVGKRGIVALVYAGGPVKLEAPNISSVSTTDENQAEICVDEDEWPEPDYDEYRVRVEYAVTAKDGTKPAADSGEWQLAGYLDAPGCVKTNPVPTGSKVWPRVRAEADDFLPSEDGGGADPVETAETPALVRHEVFVDPDTRIATVTWGENEFTDQVEVRAKVHDGSESLSATLPLVATVDASLRTYTLSGLPIAEGDFISIDLVAKAAAGTLAEGTDGQLAHHISGDATNPFSTGDWTGDGASLTLSGGDLHVDNDGSNNRGARYTADGVRSDQMVRARMKYNVQHAFGPAVLSVGRDDLITLRWAMAANAARLQEWVGGAGTTLDSETVPEKVADTYYWGGVWADTGGNAAGYDFDGDVLVETAAHNISADGRGAVSNRDPASGAGESDTSHFYLDSGRYLDVSGLSSGQKAKVLDASDNVLAEATENSGTAAVDLVGVRPDQAVVIQVTDASDTELARLTPTWDYIAGGSTATFTAGTASTTSHRIVGENPSRSVATPTSVGDSLDSLVFDKDLNLVVDDNLNLVTDD